MSQGGDEQQEQLMFSLLLQLFQELFCLEHHSDSSEHSAHSERRGTVCVFVGGGAYV